MQRTIISQRAKAALANLPGSAGSGTLCASNSARIVHDGRTFTIYWKVTSIFNKVTNIYQPKMLPWNVYYFWAVNLFLRPRNLCTQLDRKKSTFVKSPALSLAIEKRWPYKRKADAKGRITAERSEGKEEASFTVLCRQHCSYTCAQKKGFIIREQISSVLLLPNKSIATR